MIKTIARLLLLRVLPRRIVPIVTVVEALLFLRGLRNRSRGKVRPPTRLRTSTAPTARTTTSRPSPNSPNSPTSRTSPTTAPTAPRPAAETPSGSLPPERPPLA